MDTLGTAADRAGPQAFLLHAPRQVLLGLIRVYQATIGPTLPPSCRFQPTCSQYAYAAVSKYGVLRGTWLALKRLLRCHPFGGSGYDPVP